MDFLTALLVDGHKRGRLRYRGEYVYPARFGAWADAYGSSKAGNMLENNEQSIKKYVRGNDEN